MSQVPSNMVIASQVGQRMSLQDISSNQANHYVQSPISINNKRPNEGLNMVERNKSVAQIHRENLYAKAKKQAQ